MNNSYTLALETYQGWKKDLTHTPSMRFNSDMECLFDYIEDRQFPELPASLKHHLNITGGLLIHSVNVTKTLVDLTEHLGLTWERPESPFIVGLFHDLCKLEFYKEENGKFVHNDNPEYNFGGHGMLSVMIAQKFIKLTDEELHCIRFHMGAYEQKDWSMFDTAIKKYPSVLYTHTADMIASKILEK